MNKLLKWLVIATGIMVVLIIVLVVIANIATSPEYEVIEESDREDSFNVRVETEQTSEDELKLIIEDVKEEYSGVDAVWLWIHKTGEDTLLATAKIPYNEKGQTMIGEDEIIIEFK